MNPDPWTCAHCGVVFVIPHLAAHPNRNHRPGCPLQTQEPK